MKNFFSFFFCNPTSQLTQFKNKFEINKQYTSGNGMCQSTITEYHDSDYKDFQSYNYIDGNTHCETIVLEYDSWYYGYSHPKTPVCQGKPTTSNNGDTIIVNHCVNFKSVTTNSLMFSQFSLFFFCFALIFYFIFFFASCI